MQKEPKMNKPDFAAMLEQAQVNEKLVRSALKITIAQTGASPLEVINTHNQTIETVMALNFYLEEDEDEDEEPESDLRLMLEGEASEDVFQMTMDRSKKEEKMNKPKKRKWNGWTIHAPKHRWEDKI